jgi:cytochrome c-type biogenesis protein CcmH
VAAASSPPSSGRTFLRRWAPWLLIAIVVIGAGVVGVQRSTHPSLDQRTLSVAGQIRCPVCNGQSVAESDAPPSLAIRSQIRTELMAGEPPHQILAAIVRSYGPGILEKPDAMGVGLIVWLVPAVVVAGAIVGLVLAFRRWRPSAPTQPRATETDRELVGDALREPPPTSGPVPSDPVSSDPAS